MATPFDPPDDQAPIKSVPANLEAERAVLGSALIDPDAMLKLVRLRLRPEHFFRERHAMIYAAMLRLHEDKKPLDFVTVIDQLEASEDLENVGGPAYLTDLIGGTPSSINADYYARRVMALAKRRAIIAFAGDLAEWAYDDDGDDDETALVDKLLDMVHTRFTLSENDDLEHVGVIATRVVDRIDYLAQHPNAIDGVPTGFVLLDRMLGGLQKGDLIVIGAPTGAGKTSFAANIILNTAKRHSVTSALFSLEMTQEQIVERLLAIETGIDSHRLRLGQVHDDEWTILLEAANVVSGTQIYVDGSARATVNDIRAKVRMLHQKLVYEHGKGLDLVVIDYLQLMDTAGASTRRQENRQQEIATVSRALKRLAMELNIPIVVLSQLNRDIEERADKKPKLSDIRESGAPAQDASVVMLIYREDMYNPETDRQNIADVIVAKHRHGDTGSVPLYFRKELNQFRDLEIQRTELDY